MDDQQLIDELFDAIATRLQPHGLVCDRRSTSLSLRHHGHFLTIDSGTRRAFAAVVMEFSGPDHDDVPNVFWLQRPSPNQDLLEMNRAAPVGVDDLAADIVNTLLRRSEPR